MVRAGNVLLVVLVTAPQVAGPRSGSPVGAPELLAGVAGDTLGAAAALIGGWRCGGAVPRGADSMVGDGDEGPDGSMGGRLRRGGVGRADGRRAGAGVRGPASGACGLTGWNFSDVFEEVANLAVPVVGFVLASRRPANRIGWLFLVAGLALGLGGFSTAYGLHALVAAPGSLPAGRAVAWLSNWIWVIPLAMLAFVFLLFPTGRLRSRRWRPAAWFVGGAFTLTAVDLLVNATRFWSDPFGPASQAWNPLVLAAVLILMLAALVVSVVAVVVRFARSAGEERLQLKWFAAAALLVVATFIPSILIEFGGRERAARTWRSCACGWPSASRC